MARSTQVARRAGVSVDTVYTTSVGRKPQMLLAVHDMALSGGDEPLEATRRDYVAALRAAPSAVGKLRTSAAALADRPPHAAPPAEALHRAAEDDEPCRAVWEGLEARRVANMLDLARELRATGDLRPGLTDEQVAHLLWITNCPAFYRLATAGGRGAVDYADLVLDLWAGTFLAGGGRPAAD